VLVSGGAAAVLYSHHWLTLALAFAAPVLISAAL